jgi:hypothetical protein
MLLLIIAAGGSVLEYLTGPIDKLNKYNIFV